MVEETQHTVRIFDITQHLVNVLYDAKIGAGEHLITWSGRNNAGIDVPPGMESLMKPTA